MQPLSHCVGRSIRLSVRWSDCPSVGPSHLTFFAFLSSLKVEKFRYEYFMDVIAPAQIITAPTPPLATGVAVYTAMFFVAEDDPIFI